MLIKNKQIQIIILVILSVCVSCKKEKTDTASKYHYYRLEVTPSDTIHNYQVKYWFKYFNVDKSYQKGNFISMDSILKSSLPEKIYIAAGGGVFPPFFPIRVSLKIYIDGNIVKEIEGPISSSPYVFQRIEHFFY